jgi:uncharacterized membrane protein/osmotically-inducible protein OsmY
MKRSYVGGLGGVVLGMGVMYLLDPSWGRRRRRLVRDKAVRAAHQVEFGARRTAADMRHRARGVRAGLAHLLHRRPPDDRVLEERVRARLGRASSHPHAILVFADAGQVELSGPILRAELDRLLREVGRVPGVSSVKDRLQVHERPDNVPSLQGAAPIWQRPRPRTPTARLMNGVAGACLLAASARLPAPVGQAARVISLWLLARGISRRPLSSMLGLASQRQAIEVDKIFEVTAGVPAVFALWSNFESFPRFLSHVKEVRRTQDGNYQWAVTGPLGTTVSWTSEMNRYVPNRAIGWRSLPGSPVETMGEVRFRRSRRGTRVELRMAYRPPAGTVGHGVARLLGADPRKQIDDDVIRFKSLLEEGKATGRHETVSGEQVLPGIADRPPAR